MNGIIDEIWDRVVGGLDWLKQVIVGEFDDNRDLSAIVTDMLVSFVPGVVIVTSARDLTAVIIRLAKHPERRDDMHEWMLLVACVVPLVLPIIAAAVGAAAAGVGAVVGGIAGSEAGAVLRSVCLMLIKASTRLAEIVGHLKKFVSGNVMKVLHDIRFAQYADDIVKYLKDFIDGLNGVIRRVRAAAQKANTFGVLNDVLRRLRELERAFYAVQSSATRAVPKALAELDARLQKVLSEALEPERALAYPGITAPKVDPLKVEAGRVPAMSSNPLGTAGGTSPPKSPSLVEPKPNLHPEKSPPRERKPRQPASKNQNIDHSRTTKNPDGSTTYYDKQGRPVTYKDGYPDFGPYSEANVEPTRALKGKIPPDDAYANEVAGLSSTPDGYTWHHHQDGKTMQLVPTDVHETFPHTGGASRIRHGRKGG